MVLSVMTAGSPVPCLLSQSRLNEQLTEKKAGAGGGRVIYCSAKRSLLYFLFNLKGSSAGFQG